MRDVYAILHINYISLRIINNAPTNFSVLAVDEASALVLRHTFAAAQQKSLNADAT